MLDLHCHILPGVDERQITPPFRVNTRKPCAIVTAMQRNFWRFYGYRPTSPVACKALR